jgi:hypothetical protein
VPTSGQKSVFLGVAALADPKLPLATGNYRFRTIWRPSSSYLNARNPHSSSAPSGATKSASKKTELAVDRISTRLFSPSMSKSRSSYATGSAGGPELPAVALAVETDRNDSNRSNPLFRMTSATALNNLCESAYL